MYRLPQRIELAAERMQIDSSFVTHTETMDCRAEAVLFVVDAQPGLKPRGRGSDAPCNGAQDLDWPTLGVDLEGERSHRSYSDEVRKRDARAPDRQVLNADLQDAEDAGHRRADTV